MVLISYLMSLISWFSLGRIDFSNHLSLLLDYLICHVILKFLTVILTVLPPSSVDRSLIHFCLFVDYFFLHLFIKYLIFGYL